MYLAVTLAALLGLSLLSGCTRSNPAFREIAQPDARADDSERADAALGPRPPPDAAPTAPDAAPALDTALSGAALEVGSDGWVAALDGPTQGTVIGALDITVTGMSLTRRYGGGGGIERTDLCPDDQVLVGYRGADDAFSLGRMVTALEGVCGRLTLRSEGGLAVALAAGRPLPKRGDADVEWEAMCDTDEVVVGFGGLASSLIDQIQIQCAHIDLVGDPLRPTVGKATPLDPHGGTLGTVIREGGCPPGQVARGHQIRFGYWIDAFGLVCGTPELRER